MTQKIPVQRKKIFILITIVMVLLLVELIAWIAYYTIATDFERRALKNVGSGSSDSMMAQYCIPHPFTLFIPAPNFSAKGTKQHNSLGFRSSKELRQEQDVFRIVCMGGSTTYGWGVKENPDWAYPQQMEQILNQKNSKIEVINAGMPMASSAEIFPSFHYRILALKPLPKVLVVHCGLNDSYPILMPNYKPDYTHDRIPWRSKILSKYRFWLNFKSFQVFYLLLKYRGKKGRFSASYIHPNHKKWHQYFTRALKEAKDPARYEGVSRNLHNLLVLCQAYKIKVVLTPTTLEKGTLQKYPAFALCYKRIAKIMKNFATKFSHVTFVDTQNLDIPKKAFADFCHLRKEGQEIKAMTIAKTILPLVPQK